MEHFVFTRRVSRAPSRGVGGMVVGTTRMSNETITLLNAEEVAAMLGVSERTLWRLLSAGKFPKPVRFGRSTRWRLADVREWIDCGCPRVGDGVGAYPDP